jgi:hypothetical protein
VWKRTNSKHSSDYRSPPGKITQDSQQIPPTFWGDGRGHIYFTDENLVYEADLKSGDVSVVASAPSGRSATRIGGLWGAGGLLIGTESPANTVFQIDLSKKQASTIAGVTNPSSPKVELPQATSAVHSGCLRRTD